jgi:8-oxo-dGTP pyrophosphatase MutT (NUDIX family)
MPNYSAAPLLTREAIAGRLLTPPPPGELFLRDDLERREIAAAHGELTPAAVLLLVVNHADTQTVVFTQRTAHLAAHAGQISFPGGRLEARDESADAGALREAHEEVGVDPSRVEVLGRLPEYHTSTGYLVTPVVGWARAPLAYAPDPHEVAEVFEVPLAFLLDSRNHRYESAFFKGRTRHFWAMPFGPRYIWGATAGMLVTFQRIMAAGDAAR